MLRWYDVYLLETYGENSLFLALKTTSREDRFSHDYAKTQTQHMYPFSLGSSLFTGMKCGSVLNNLNKNQTSNPSSPLNSSACMSKYNYRRQKRSIVY